MIIFRPHRSSLDETMKEAKEFDDVEKMKEAAIYFIGEHDFAAFKSSGTSSKSSVRTIYDAKIYQNGDKIRCMSV